MCRWRLYLSRTRSQDKTEDEDDIFKKLIEANEEMTKAGKVLLALTIAIVVIAIIIYHIILFIKWDTVNITVAGRNITVYYADTFDKMSEGYKYKYSYDFAGKGAVGILFPLYKLDTTRVCFTMRDVNLDLILVVARRTSRDYTIEEKIYMQKGSSDTCIDIGDQFMRYEAIAIEIDPSKSDLFPLGAVIKLPER